MTYNSRVRCLSKPAFSLFGYFEVYTVKISRRKFIEVVGLFTGLYLFTPGALIPAEGSFLRPPGAIPEEEFLAKCIRCLKCGEICPTGAIKFAGWSIGQSSETPVLSDLYSNPCVLCMKCTTVCPSGALSPISPNPTAILDNVKIGLAHIKRRNCYLVTGERVMCRLCAGVCPLNAVTLMGPMSWPIIDKDRCVGCGICQNVCPAKAINVEGIEA